MSAKSVILVHGAWADGSSWAKVIPLLRAKSIEVIAVQMPLTRFEDDVACLRRALVQVSGNAVLVGHSYGGSVITEAGTDEKVSALVYIAAFAPDAGESPSSLGETAEPAAMSAELRADSQGFLKLTEEGVFRDFAQDLTDVEQGILFAAQAPTSAAALGGKISTPAWRSKPSWYLVAGDDRAIQPELERRMAERMNAETVELASSHVLMLSHPEETAALILQAVGSV